MLLSCPATWTLLPAGGGCAVLCYPWGFSAYTELRPLRLLPGSPTAPARQQGRPLNILTSAPTRAAFEAEDSSKTILRSSEGHREGETGEAEHRAQGARCPRA